MLPIVHYQDILYLMINEIDQSANLNAYTRIFRYDSAHIFKFFSAESELIPFNIEVLNDLAEARVVLKKIPELILPEYFVKLHGEIVGYVMPYAKGVVLSEFLQSKKFGIKDKVQVISNIADVLNRLNRMYPSMHIGDLHEENILVDDCLDIRLIDLDCCYVNHFRPFTARYLEYFKNKMQHHKCKYRSINNIPVPSYQTDLLCLIVIIINWISGEEYFLQLPKNEMTRYFKYLKSYGMPRNFQRMIECVWGYRSNYFQSDYLQWIPEDIASISFMEFKRSLYSEYDNKQAEKRLIENRYLY